MNTQQRDREIVEDYQDRGLEIPNIAREQGITEHRVRQILKGSNVALRPRCQVSKKSPISPIHERLGRYLYDYRFDNGIDARHAANALNLSLVKLNKIEQGVTEVEMLELQDISSYIGVSVSDIMKE